MQLFTFGSLILFCYHRDTNKALAWPLANAHPSGERNPHSGQLIHMHHQRIGARAEYLIGEKERIKASLSLAEKFPGLKSLSVTLTYFAPGGLTRHSGLKCSFNLAHARSLLRFDCPNNECVGGNFDLTAELARAVAERRGVVSGETRCEGWQSKTTIDQVYCGHILRYKLVLRF
jgi:hypothetical protein